MSQLLYSIEEVFSNKEYLKQQEKNFYNIPLYQRGYKWEPKHVTKLLVDIDNFQVSDAKFYCLQNITIVPKDNYFNIVDGQQRLTTLTIILAYLQEEELVYNKVRFPENSIRKETNRFLNEIITKQDVSFPEEDWDVFIDENKDYDHQDIYHIFQVYKTIDKWFEEKESQLSFSKENYRNKLLKHVKFIINKIDDKTSSEEKIFGNLNSKRIPLDGADLVRAVLITRVAKEEGKREADIKNIVRVNERRVKIGWQLDQINNWWSKENVRHYFSKFVSVSSERIGTIKLFDDNKYPINILYLLFAEKKGEEVLTLELIEKNNNDALGLYKEIIKLNSTLQDWFQDKEIYHYLGFLFNQKLKRDFNYSTVWQLWEDCNTRDLFKEELIKEMKSSLMTDDELISFVDTSINWYKKEPRKLVSALILMDIIHSIKNNQPFLPYSSFNKATNDIEHIFPQNPENIKDKKAYIVFLNTYVVAKDSQFDVSEFDLNKDDDEYLDTVDDFIETQIEAINIDSIGNLVLLYNSLNRSISNNPYAKKRARIIEYFNKGNFIQPHTFQVFVRYFNDDSNDVKDFEHWTNNDIEANAKRIDTEINNFFKTDSDE
ncbi:DUF262 domain-containing protein [Polaribacter butkevichii]|uniref:DUF262 domain-containing protein n=1 Tax=Polaribacter butkevichii TaxID=218490 RepID=A0A2P6CFD1_9FLAO|nr:DUF262 domain-containing protein [Polaribacter butkevichii]PQJ73594.1 hypothetical protein BTO14_10090 [Polaribacter butkevichii]